MKRFVIFGIILICFVAVCFGQRRQRGSSPRLIQLPAPNLTGPVSLEEALAKRRSIRRFTAQPLNFGQIGQLAWAGQGITEPEKGFRTAPSAGAIYPIELYLATQEGLFAYQPEKHNLEQLSGSDIRDKLSTAAFEQRAVAEAACDIIIAGKVKKLAAKYGNKARRYMLLEAGHIAQNIQLQAVGLGLGSVPVGAFDIRDVSRVCRLPANLEPIYVICVGYPAKEATIETSDKEKEIGEVDRTVTKKAALIIAADRFRDEELFETQSAVAAAGVEIVIASSRKRVIRGMRGGKAEATILVNELKVDDYDAIVFIGGAGAREYFDSTVALNIAREAAQKQKVLAAICIAPTVLANAGLLKGVKATSFPSERVKLKKAGAHFTDAPVERDGLIITGKGPEAAAEFGKAVADAITGSSGPGG